MDTSVLLASGVVGFKNHCVLSPACAREMIFQIAPSSISVKSRHSQSIVAPKNATQPRAEKKISLLVHTPQPSILDPNLTSIKFFDPNHDQSWKEKQFWNFFLENPVQHEN